MGDFIPLMPSYWAFLLRIFGFIFGYILLSHGSWETYSARAFILDLPFAYLLELSSGVFLTDLAFAYLLDLSLDTFSGLVDHE